MIFVQWFDYLVYGCVHTLLTSEYELQMCTYTNPSKFEFVIPKEETCFFNHWAHSACLYSMFKIFIVNLIWRRVTPKKLVKASTKCNYLCQTMKLSWKKVKLKEQYILEIHLLNIKLRYIYSGNALNVELFGAWEIASSIPTVLGVRLTYSLGIVYPAYHPENVGVCNGFPTICYIYIYKWFIILLIYKRENMYLYKKNWR